MIKKIKYAKLILKHKAYVAWAGLTKVGGIPITQLIIHDWSKFSPSEFFAYQRQFDKGQEKDPDQWEAALQHHYNHNAHHPEYWIKADGTPLPMPEVYVREMVADWYAASKAYQGHWDIKEWVEKSVPRFNLHPVTKHHLNKILMDQDIFLDCLDEVPHD